MQFSNTGLLIKRNVYTQTGNFGFAVACTVDNTTGVYRFGMTGAAGALEFRLQSGHMYYQDQFVHTYRSNEEFLLEAQFTSGHANVIRNSDPLIYGERKVTGAFDYFYFTRENAGMNAVFDLEISGNSTPLYTITQQGYLISSGQSGVTGYFINQSAYPLKVFNSSIQASQNYTFSNLAATVGVGGSGTFSYGGDFNSIDLTQPILTTFNTSYSDVSVLFTIIDARSLSLVVDLTGPTDFTFNQSGVLNRDVSYLNYSGGFVTDAFNTSLVFQIAYQTGLETFTGVWNMFTGVNSSALISLFHSPAMISGSGLFSGNSFVNWQVTYSGLSGNAAQLLISGGYIIDPIYQTLNFNA